jgi:hypothetical protein
MTLTEFLLARLDEDEAAAREAARAEEATTVPDGGGGAAAPGVVRLSPARALAEVEAKRRIVTLAYEATGLDMDGDVEREVNARRESGVEFVGERMLRAIVLPYADHPDHDDAWLL